MRNDRLRRVLQNLNIRIHAPSSPRKCARMSPERRGPHKNIRKYHIQIGSVGDTFSIHCRLSVEIFWTSYILMISIIFRSKVSADRNKSEKGLVSSFPRICSRTSIKGGISGTPSPAAICCFLKVDSMSFAILMMASRPFRHFSYR